MKSKKVLYISQEIYPYLEGAYAKVARFLPQQIQEKKNEVRLFMPRYGHVNARKHQLHDVIRLSGQNIIVNDHDHNLLLKVASIPSARMQIYFIDNEDYFQRKGEFIPHPKHGNDNDERSIFFVRGVLETIKRLRWMPDLVHCMGWFSAMGIIYLREFYKDDPHLQNTRYVFSIGAPSEEVHMPPTLFAKLRLDGIGDELTACMQGEVDHKALMKLCITHAHGVVQAADTIDPEVLAFIQETGKPFLPYPGEEGYVDAYETFYDTVLQ